MRKNVTPYFLLAALLLLTHAGIHAQTALLRKNLPDTILKRRTLLLPDPFNEKTALLSLFPGKWYDLSSKMGFPDKFVNWECNTCKRIDYGDANGVEDPLPFPYRDGVATRIINVFSYRDSAGREYKLLFLNHSLYDEDGIQTGRFYGGLLGIAKFNRTDSGWRLQAFQPAVAAFGAFSQCPAPQPLLIGDDQYALMISQSNGGGGGAQTQDNYLLAGIGGTYKLVLIAFGTGRNNVGPEESQWDCTWSVLPGTKKYFRDIVIISKGKYMAADKDALPDELKDKITGNETVSFTITRVFTYSAAKGYRERLPAKVEIRH